MGRHWVPLALLGFAELVLVTVELFHRSAVTADLATRLAPDPAPPSYDSIFGFTVEGHGGTQRLLSLSDTVLAYRGGIGVAWQWVLIAAFLAVVAWYARRLGGKAAVLSAVGVLVAVPLLDLLAYSWFGFDAATRGPVLATLGLALVAWLERSRLVLAVAVVAGATAVAVADLPGVVISAAVLLAGAILPRWGMDDDFGSRWPRWGSPSS
ncbi:hypothetical protein QRX60_48075 [Amycolatopsis mongoliensis]|uniref:Uncharacterized protein n=1 Tax=Amycolatopsis mongoliensis TaxID=715475 RepID=A0A9Y2NKZ3_9PSEU|nr:hypothetical protein [Amycolatopsis sp. 4-36]WIY01695.1 hypothetical protein QRX60_48075 [Amycolatopsis sp. 4-36]